MAKHKRSAKHKNTVEDNEMKIYLGSDHGGFKLKESIKKYLKKSGYTVVDKGNTKLAPKDDYPDYGYKAAKAVSKTKNSRGILFCGSAEGICIVANKVKGIRAVAVWDLTNARLSREHNDANVLCLGAKVVEANAALKMVKIWLETEFEGAQEGFERHKRRVNKFTDIEKRCCK